MNTATTLKAPEASRDSDSLNHMLTGNLLGALVKLALPTVAVMFMTTILSVAEIYFVSSLGVHAIAAASIVVPVMMFMITISNGGVGGGVSSAVARSMGARDYAKAESIIWHAVVIGGVFGAIFSLAAFIAGPSLYQFLGGKDESLHLALIYSNILFGGAIFYWIVALLQSALRGSGNVKVPALIIFVSVILGLILSPTLILGWFGMPKLGIAGAGIAQVTGSIVSLVLLVRYLNSSNANIKLKPRRLDKDHFREILGIGLISSGHAVMSNLSLNILTAAAGVYGVATIAGFGIASRLESLLVPVLFGFGTAVITVVGANMGAGNIARARQAALINALFVAALFEVIGLTVAFAPTLWLGIFTNDAQVIKVGGEYLSLIGPLYGLIALASELYFAGQAARKIGWPLFAGATRLVCACVAMFVAVKLHFSFHATFHIMAAGIIIAGIVSFIGFKRTFQ